MVNINLGKFARMVGSDAGFRIQDSGFKIEILNPEF